VSAVSQRRVQPVANEWSSRRQILCGIAQNTLIYAKQDFAVTPICHCPLEHRGTLLPRANAGCVLYDERSSEFRHLVSVRQRLAEQATEVLCSCCLASTSVASENDEACIW